MTKVTMTDIAKAAGVSKQTVSRVVNGDGRASKATTQRIQQLIEEYGYRPSGIARSLVTNSSRTLGLIVPTLSNPYYAEIAEGAEQAAWEAGYNLFLCNVLQDAGREAATLRSLEDRGADGVIVDSPRLANRQLCDLLKHHKAAVVIGRDVPAKLAGSIVVDDAAGVKLALEHFLALGRRAIAMLTPLHDTGRVRKKAFIKYAGDAGLFDETLMVDCDTTAVGGYEETKRLLQVGTHLDALLCFNDIIAAGALKALAELHFSVPEDVAVIGHDDIAMARLLSPSLSTVMVSKRDIGANAVRMILDRLKGQNYNTQLVLRPELIARESTLGRPQQI